MEKIVSYGIIAVILVSLLNIFILNNVIMPTNLYRDPWGWAIIFDSNFIKEKQNIEIPTFNQTPYLYMTFGKTINILKTFPGIALLLSLISSTTNQPVVKLFSFFPIGQLFYILSGYLIGIIFLKNNYHRLFLILFSSIGFFGPANLRIDYSITEYSFVVFLFSFFIWNAYKFYNTKRKIYLILPTIFAIINRFFYGSTSVFLDIIMLGFGSFLFVIYLLSRYNILKTSQEKSKNFLIISLYIVFISMILIYSLGGFNVFQIYVNKVSSFFNITISFQILNLIDFSLIPISFAIIWLLIRSNLFKKIINLLNKLINVFFDSTKRIFIITFFIILISIILFFSYFSDGAFFFLLPRLFSLLFIAPGIILFISWSKKLIKNISKYGFVNLDENLNSIFYIAIFFPFFVLLLVPIFIPFLITKPFELMQVVFSLGFIMFIESFDILKKKSLYIFLLVLIFMIINNFSYLISPYTSYSSWTSNLLNGVILANKIIPIDSVILTDLKIAGGFLILNHQKVYVPFSLNEEQRTLLEKYSFYEFDKENSINIFEKNKVNYLVYTKQMQKTGIYVHDSLLPPMSKKIIDSLNNENDLDKVFTNSEVLLYKYK